MTEEETPAGPAPRPLITIQATNVSMVEATLPDGTPSMALLLMNPISQTAIVLEPATVRMLKEKLGMLEELQKMTTRKLVIARDLP